MTNRKSNKARKTQDLVSECAAIREIAKEIFGKGTKCSRNDSSLWCYDITPSWPANDSNTPCSTMNFSELEPWHKERARRLALWDAFWERLVDAGLLVYRFDYTYPDDQGQTEHKRYTTPCNRKVLCTQW